MQLRHQLVLAAALAAAACTETASAPVEQRPAEVARVSVSPDTAVVEIGRTVRLNADVLDTSGNAVNGRTVEWFTYDASVATVSSAGVVTGVAAGNATIAASVDGKRGSARVKVTGGAAGVTVTAVSPNPLVEGQPATIHGSNFGLVAANNRVTIDGAIATVTAATATTLQIVVPHTQCRPARTVDVQVRMLATPSNVLQAPIRPAQFLELPVGQQVLVRDPANFCVQLPATSASEAYLIGVQSIAENVTTVTSASVSATVMPSGNSAIIAPLPDGMAQHSARTPHHVQTAQDTAWLGIRAAEATINRGNRQLFQTASGRAGATAAMVPTVPATLRPGDVVTVRVPAAENQCTQFATINAVVRLISGRAIWLEDVANPAGGYVPADFQVFATFFDNIAYDAAVEYFGTSTDLDRNGRIAFVVTKEVNRHGAASDPLFNLAGFVKTANYFATSYCPSSNEGEVIYLRAPDPNGQFGRATFPLNQERTAILQLLPHEFAHVIQFSRQMPGSGNAFQPAWLQEAQATLVEEVVGHRVSGRTSGRNYGYDVAFDAQPVLGIPWYRGVMWLSYYYGWTSPTARVTNAPEQCSWLGMAYQGNTGPCTGTDLIAYGVGFLFMRWLADQFGTATPGGERGVMRALVDNRSAGFAGIASAVGVPIDELLAQWAAALYVDDRIPNAAPRLRLTSWNLFDIEGGKHPNGRLLPRERTFTSFSDGVSVRGGSTAYFRVSGAGRAAAAIRATSPDGSALPSTMRLWIVRLQ